MPESIYIGQQDSKTLHWTLGNNYFTASASENPKVSKNPLPLILKYILINQKVDLHLKVHGLLLWLMMKL